MKINLFNGLKVQNSRIDKQNKEQKYSPNDIFFSGDTSYIDNLGKYMVAFNGRRENINGKFFKEVTLETKWGEKRGSIGMLRSDKFLKDRFTEYKIALESTHRINGLTKGKVDWPETPRGWMVTSELKGVVTSGGLGVVALELPQAFNKVYKDKGANLDVVMPMYRFDGQDTGNIKKANGKSFYVIPKSKQELEVKKVYSVDVDVFNKGAQKATPKRADVYKTVNPVNGSNVVFIDNKEFFTVPKEADGSAELYGWNDGVDESQRYAFLSKAVSTIMENLKRDEIDENDNEGIQAPNIIVANDWQASGIAGINRYLTTAKIADSENEQEKDVQDYLYKTPIVTIVHNLAHQGHINLQGEDDKKAARESMLNTLFEDYAAEIVENAKTPKKLEHSERALTNALFDNYSNMNQMNMAMNLADYIVPVSGNYSQELLRSKAMSGVFTPLLYQRSNNGTYEGVTNGLSKANNVPSDGFINHKRFNRNKWFEENGLFKNGEKFISYDSSNLDKLVEAKTHNKRVYLNGIASIIENSRTGKNKELAINVPVIDPQNCSLEGVDIENTPLVTFVARAVAQKGFGILKESVIKVIENAKSPEDVPIMVIDVSGGGDKNCENQIKELKQFLTKNYPKHTNKIIPIIKPGINANFDPITQMAADYFMVPSMFEPCGLTQLEAMYRGTPALVTSTGGLKTTVDDGVTGFTTSAFYSADAELIYNRDGEGAHHQTAYDNEHEKANGGLFADIINRAVDLYRSDRPGYNQMMKRAMDVDFSWEQGAIQKYLEIFTGQRATGKAPLDLEVEQQQKTVFEPKNVEVPQKEVLGPKKEVKKPESLKETQKVEETKEVEKINEVDEAEETTSVEESTNETEPKETKRPNAFRRFFRAIGNFFRRLFGGENK